MTRTWNAVAACAGMRRGLALAYDYATKRVAFGAPIGQKPLHVDTLAGVQAELDGALLLAFRTVELLGREELKTLTEEEGQLLRLLTPIVKATTAKQAVASASGSSSRSVGRDMSRTQGCRASCVTRKCCPSGRGRRTVLSLDLLRALGKTGSLAPIEREVGRRRRTGARRRACAQAGKRALEAVAHARAWIEATMPKGVPAMEAGARRFALTLGRALELAAPRGPRGVGRPARRYATRCRGASLCTLVHRPRRRRRNGR